MTSVTIIRGMGLMVFLATLAICQPQTTYIPQVVDGGAWQTVLVLSNTTTSGASASLSFHQETSGGATQSWNLAFLEGSTQNVLIPAGSAVFLHTLRTDSVTSQGWADMIASPSVVAYAIFTQRIPGRTDQDGTAPASGSATRFLVPFDNTGGFVTSVGIANLITSSQTISVNIEIENGAISQTSIPDLPAQGHTAFALPQQFPATGGHRGLIEFYVAGGRTGTTGPFSTLALRFNPTGGFTSAPVYAQSGNPVIGVSPPVAKK